MLPEDGNVKPSRGSNAFWGVLIYPLNKADFVVVLISI
jgi:hypothetical protein